MSHFLKQLSLTGVTLILAWSFNCNTWAMKAPEIMQKRQECLNAGNATLEQLYKLHPEAKQKIQQAAGYAAFEQVGLKILIVGGGSGKGIAANNKTQARTYMQITDSLAQVSLGINQYSSVFLFENQKAYNNFITHTIHLKSPATLTAKKNGPYPGAIPVASGVWLYQIVDNKLLVEFIVNGVQFSPYTELNQGL
jgi:lipid-binding SYLF domain-containing protein